MPSELPDNIVPYLQAVNQRMFEGQAPLDFWRMDDDRSIVTGFMDLAGLLQLAILDGETHETWPSGYKMLMVLFQWEAEAQSDGWNQYFESSDDHIEGVCSLYKFVGLPDEAQSIRRARNAGNQSGLVEDVSAAYGAATHPYSADLDRLDFLAHWFRDNADFYLYKL